MLVIVIGDMSSSQEEQALTLETAGLASAPGFDSQPL